MKPRLASLHASPPVTPPRPKPAKAQGPSKNDITKVKQLLFDIYNAPYKPVSDRYKQVFGSAGGLGNRIKNLALQWQYAKEIKIHTGNRSGLKIFLVLTPNGYQLICMPPQQRQGIGDFEHQYWQHCLFEECCNRGYAPIKELQIRGKRVDVGLRFPKLIAMEVATTPANELSNVQKDLKSGFDLIVICATTKNVQAKVESILLQHLKPQDWVHVEVCTVQDYLQQTAWF